MPTIHHIMLGMFTNYKEKNPDTLHMNVQELELQHENYTDAGVHSITTGESVPTVPQRCERKRNTR